MDTVSRYSGRSVGPILKNHARCFDLFNAAFVFLWLVNFSILRVCVCVEGVAFSGRKSHLCFFAVESIVPLRAWKHIALGQQRFYGVGCRVHRRCILHPDDAEDMPTFYCD